MMGASQTMLANDSRPRRRVCAAVAVASRRGAARKREKRERTSAVQDQLQKAAAVQDQLQNALFLPWVAWESLEGGEA